MNKIFRLGELFCGAGGLSYGAMTAQIDNNDSKIVHQWANDFAPDACATYIRNICPNDPDTWLWHYSFKYD